MARISQKQAREIALAFNSLSVARMMLDKETLAEKRAEGSEIYHAHVQAWNRSGARAVGVLREMGIDPVGGDLWLPKK
jgi:hypothetical protein